MSSFTLCEEIDIARPADEVWALVADYARDPEWRTAVVAMVPTPAGLVRPGTTTAEALRLAGKTWHNDGEVAEVEPGTRFTWRTTEGADAHGSRAVVPLGEGTCRVRLELTVRPHGAERLMAPVLRRMLARNLAADVQALRRLAETSARPTAPA